MCLAEVICSDPLDIQKDVVSVNKMEGADANRGKVPATPHLEDIY
jgi:hypothetical protein